MEKNLVNSILNSLKVDESVLNQELSNKNALVKVKKYKSLSFLTNQLINTLKKIKKSKKHVSYIMIPLKHFNIFYNTHFQIYGGFYININILAESDPIKLNFSVAVSEYYKKNGILILDLKPREDSIRDMKSIIKQIRSISHTKYEAIAQSLEDLQPLINQDIIDQQDYLKIIEQQNLKKTYEELYQQFENWAVQYVKSLNGHFEFFSFYILKFDLNTLETITMKVGYSSAFLELRGSSWEKQGSNYSKNLFSFFTKETAMNYLLKITKATIYGKINMEKPSLLTLDKLSVPFIGDGINISNRIPQYPYCNNQLIPKNKIPEFQLNIRKYKIALSEIKNVFTIRQSRPELENVCLNEDFSFSTEAFEFIQKFYQDHKNLPSLKGYQCGEICCNYQKTDVFLLKNNLL